MKFLRHLAAATAVVAVVVLAGVAWNHFWPSVLVNQMPHGPGILVHGVRVGPGEHIAPGGRVGPGHGPVSIRPGQLPPGGRITLRGDGRVEISPGVSAFYGLLRKVNLMVLEETAKVEALFIAAVVIIDIIRRRIRRIRRIRRARCARPAATSL